MPSELARVLSLNPKPLKSLGTQRDICLKILLLSELQDFTWHSQREVIIHCFPIPSFFMLYYYANILNKYIFKISWAFSRISFIHSSENNNEEMANESVGQ